MKTSMGTTAWRRLKEHAGVFSPPTPPSLRDGGVGGEKTEFKFRMGLRERERGGRGMGSE